MAMDLRYYQQEAIDGIYHYFLHQQGNPIVDMATGTGKSVVIAEFVRRALADYPGTRVLMLTHVRELIEQNYRKLVTVWPMAPAGICSAGLGSKNTWAQIVYAGIQTIHRKVRQLGPVDLVLVDECHLIPRSSDTMYGKFLEALRSQNPYLKVIGFTATPYRLDSGYLHKGDGAMFDGIAYSYDVAKGISDGYLCEVVPKQTQTQLDITGVGRRGGEFIAGQLEAAVDVDEITKAAVAEIVAQGKDRGSWLCFCAGVKHAEHVAEEIRSYGISCATVTGDTPTAERDRILAAFKAGHIRALTNANILTTGFDAPGTDLIAMLRPTASTGLYVQMIGRGTRLAEGKEDCLVLDFAGNVARHGPLDKLNVKEPGKGGDGEAPVKVCPEEHCAAILHASIRICPHCGHEFPPPDIKVSAVAGRDALLTSQIVDEWHDVTDVAYARHQKPGKPPSLRVDYRCGLTMHREWVCLEHAGFPREKACQWWMKRAPGQPVPATVDDALAVADTLPRPQAIRIRPEGKYTAITGVRF